MSYAHAETATRVHIVISDRGWILERLAKEITDRFSYITYDISPDPAAFIQYYMTYGCRGERVSPIEIGLFTHREHDETAAARFDTAVRELDHAVAMSGSTLQIVNALGAASSSCIMPGVDIDAFRPKLKIAVVGRTYHTGRKGEGLVRAVMDVPDIEWHFTGEGWPGPAEHVPDADLPAFYRSMDYVLIPALNEGGPMSVLEALASGVEVIASDVGWVTEFPHIPFKRGDADSLRQVLMELRERRMSLRSSVEHVTWERWARDHDKLFRKMASAFAASHRTGPIAEKNDRLARTVALVTHGIEDTTLGGPSRRVPSTAQALRKLLVSAKVSHERTEDMAAADLVHGFNIWQPKTALRLARQAKRLNKPLIFSPIILDLSEAPLWQADLFRAFRGAASGNAAEALINHYAQVHRERMALLPPADPEPGYRDMLVEIAELADGLIFLSEHERATFAKVVGAVHTPGYLVRNPVDAAHFHAADRNLFREAYGLQDYVVCVARVEPRKNQLMLVNALRDSNLPIVLIGHDAHPEYATLIKRFGGPNVIMIDRLEPNSDMLRSAIAGARVFVLPSWAEGAPLTALEAAATGANMVLSNRSGEREYVGDFARYCDPSDPRSIRDTVLEAWDSPLDPDAQDRLRKHVEHQFSWPRHAQQTRDVYEDVLARLAAAPDGQRTASAALPAAPARDSKSVIFDVTTWANNASTLSGIVRVERSIAMELIARTDISARFVIYYSSSVGFIELPREVIQHDVLGSYVTNLKLQAFSASSQISLPEGGDLIAVGSSWMQNAEYTMELIQLARYHNLKLSVLMHDMTPALFPHWYADGYSAPWEKNCASLLAHAHRLLVYSDSTLKDVVSFSTRHKITMPVSAKIRLADEVGTLETTPTTEGLAARDRFRRLPFVLAVGGIHLRKNYGLLYDVWLILRETMGDACPHLVIAGGVSWNGAETARIMRDDPKVRSHIHILDNIDDGTLDWLYQHTLMTAYPSLYEGWGLPVGESLAHGKICLSSSSSSMKEIAPEVTDLIDPFDRLRWASMIRHYATSPSSRASREAEIREKFAITSWRDTTDHIIEALAGESSSRLPAVYNLGDIAIVGTGGDGAAYLASGWYASEQWGLWAKSRTPTIHLRFAHRPDEDVVLTLLAMVLKPASEALHYNITANGRAVGLWHFPACASGSVDSDLLVNRVVIPRDAIGEAGELLIELIGDRLCSVHEVTPQSDDARRLGLGLSAFLIERQSQASDAAVLFSTRPDVRAALGLKPAVDLPTILTETANRPAARPDTNIQYFEPFCRVGLPHSQAGAAADRGCLTLALGVARLRLDRAATVQCVIEAPLAAPDHPVTVTIFANGRFLQTIRLANEAPTLFDFEVPPAVLAAVDPLSLSFLGSWTRKIGDAAFFVNMIRFSQGMLLPSQQRTRLAIGQTLRLGRSPDRSAALPHMLAGGWSALEEQGVWSLGETGRLCFAVAPEAIGDAILLLEIERQPSGRDDDSVAFHGPDDSLITELAFPLSSDMRQWTPLPLRTVADADGLVDIRFVSNNPGSPDRDTTSSGGLRRFGVRLLSIGLHAPNIALTLDGWHEWEPGGRWTAESMATFAFWKSDKATMPLIDGAMLVPPHRADREVSLRYSVNGGPAEVFHLPPDEAAAITLPLAGAIDPGFYMVTLSGMELVAPMSLGMNEDPRSLGFCLHSISFSPTNGADDVAEEGA